MNPDFYFTKFLTNQIVFHNEKNQITINKPRLVKIVLLLNWSKFDFVILELVKVDPMKLDTYLKQTKLLS